MDSRWFGPLVLISCWLILVLSGFCLRIAHENYNKPKQSASSSTTERDFQTLIQAQIGGVAEYVLDDGTRVDLLLPTKAIEIDWQEKWAEAVGQAIYYGGKTGRAPSVILLGKDSKVSVYQSRVRFCGVACDVFNVDTMNFEGAR